MWKFGNVIFGEKEKRSTQRKTSRTNQTKTSCSKDENQQQTQPTYDAASSLR